jgi:2'-5' RNA ligase
MIKYDIPWWNKFVSSINKDYIYDVSGFGIEFEPHVTILYGFHDEVGVNAIKEYVNKINKPIQITLTGISSFNTENYDVLKFDVVSPTLHKLNKFFQKLPNTNSFKEYRPHMTIAYMLSGRARTYETQLNPPLRFVSSTYSFSDKVNNKDSWTITGE